MKKKIIFFTLLWLGLNHNFLFNERKYEKINILKNSVNLTIENNLIQTNLSWILCTDNMSSIYKRNSPIAFILVGI